MKLAFVVLLAFVTPGAAQVRSPSWATELVAGAASDMAARGPWMDRGWRRSLMKRVSFGIGLSVAYEYAVEPWNGHTNAGRSADVFQRLAGTFVAEGLWTLAREIFR